jgi:hypothetical protein
MVRRYENRRPARPARHPELAMTDVMGDHGVMVSWWLRRGAVTLAALAAPIVVALALLPVRSQVPNATVALGLAVVVTVVAAATTSRLDAALAGLAAALSFDFLDVRPYSSLSIARAQDVETTLLLLVVALVVGQLAARNQTHRRLAATASNNLARVHSIAEMVAAGDSVEEVLGAVDQELTSLLDLQACRFDPSFTDRPGPFIERAGSVSWGGLRWGFATMGLPAKEVTLMIEHDGRPLGRFVLVGTPASRVTEDDLVTAVALADQAGASMAAHSQRL